MHQLLYKLILILLLPIGSLAVLEADHPIYILLTHPRATGTAFEKILRTKEEVNVVHAPFFTPWIRKKYPPNHPFVLELKDPTKSVISFHRKMPSVDESIVGHRQLWDLYVYLETLLESAPLVIDSDRLLKDPLPILTQLGKHWNLSFDSSNLRWKAAYASDWPLRDWYLEVGHSTQLEETRQVERDDKGIPLYLEVGSSQEKSRLIDIYRIQNGYYQNLLQRAVTI